MVNNNINIIYIYIYRYIILLIYMVIIRLEAELECGEGGFMHPHVRVLFFQICIKTEVTVNAVKVSEQF